ncbi:hypothetical protein H6G93_20855 [Nostoc sp. FACHB-973]|nr:hypothetical protein [Nostoc sp. FACHB-973]
MQALTQVTLSRCPLPTPSLQSPVPSPQSPVPSPQSPVSSPQSPIPSPQSPVPNPQSPVLGYISLWTCQKGLQGARHEIVAENGVREAPPLEFSDSQARNDIGTGMWLNQLWR